MCRVSIERTLFLQPWVESMWTNFLSRILLERHVKRVSSELSVWTSARAPSRVSVKRTLYMSFGSSAILSECRAYWASVERTLRMSFAQATDWVQVKQTFCMKLSLSHIELISIPCHFISFLQLQHNLTQIVTWICQDTQFNTGCHILH